MKRNDARVRYTQKILKESFLKLLKEKPVNKITVKEVCELAGLNRATFYAHYSDCFDLMEKIEQELIETFAASIRSIDSFDVRALIEAIYMMVEENEEACMVLVFQGASPSILGKMLALARESSIEPWKQQLKKASEAELEMLFTHLSSGLMQVVVEGYNKYSREELGRFVERIVTGSLALFC